MGWISDLLQGIPVNAVLKERVALAEQKFKDLEAQNKALSDKVASLLVENDALKAQVNSYSAKEKASADKPTMEWGCYKFEGEPGLFCPRCYETQGKKHQTTRMNPHRRRCVVCQTDFGN
jgi:hypothetical protein